jgi:hypothetical protein
MSSFVNYFAPLAQDERTPITQEPVKNGLRNRRSIARVARRRAIERQRIEDAQVEQNESLTHNIFAWQAAHPLMYCSMSCFMFGHQKSRFANSYVFEIPGCPAQGVS